MALAAAWLTLEQFGGFGRPLKPLTVLVVGVDERREDVGRTDTIILVTYNPTKKSAQVVWVPRDTRVVVPGYDYHQKVNAAYALGGVDLTRRTIEAQFGIMVDRYLLVDFAGFVQAVDALGGVTVEIPRPLDYDDRAQDLHIHLPAGTRRLSGEEALGFVRYRSDGLGDVSLVDPVNKVYEGRISRQQEFVQAVERELLKPQNVWRLPGIVRIVSRTVQTDLPLGELIAYARSARGLSRGSVVTSLLPGEGVTLGGVSYWVPAPGAAEHLAAEHRSFERAPKSAAKPSLNLPELPDLKQGLAKVVSAMAPVAPRPLPPARVSVLNGTGEPGLAGRAAASLKGQGLVVTAVGNAERYSQAATRVVNVAGREDAVATIRKLAPKLKVVEAGEGITVPADADLVVVVGSDFRP